MRKAFCVSSILILGLSLTACGSDFDGSRIGNDREFTMDHSVLNKTDSQDLAAALSNKKVQDNLRGELFYPYFCFCYHVR